MLESNNVELTDAIMGFFILCSYPNRIKEIQFKQHITLNDKLKIAKGKRRR